MKLFSGITCFCTLIMNCVLGDKDDVVPTTSNSEPAISARFKAADMGTVFQHLALEKDSGRVFVGGTNSLFQLDLDSLTMQKSVSTGPDKDSPYCSWNGKDCIRPSIAGMVPDSDREDGLTSSLRSNGTLRLMNNFNQVLTIYKKRKLLIACGSLHQGICSLHKLEDISQTLPPRDPVPVAANSANASTVAFVASGKDSDQDSLYVAATYTYEPYRGDFPALATRSLRESDIFSLEDEGDVQGQSSMIIMSEFRSDFRVRYIGGFYSEGFAYWASVQRENPTEHRAPFVTKLLRVCTHDTRYVSYSELPLECRGPDNSKYNLLRAIRVSRMGEGVVNSPGFSEEYRNKNDPAATEFLVGIFAKGTDPDKPGRESAVCVFPLKEIRAGFWYNIERCQNGNGLWNLPHFGFNRQCRNVSKFSLNKDECSLGRVGGTMPVVQMAAVALSDSLLSGVSVDVVRNHTVLVLGTTDGRLKKVYLETASKGKEYSEVQLSPLRSSVASDMVVLGDGKHHLLTMAGNELYKVQIPACELYRTCATCQQSGDPYCGWCTLQKKCRVMSECSSATEEHRWIPVSPLRQWEDGDSVCPRLGGPLEPQNVSVFAPMTTEVKIRMNLLPRPKGDALYQCIFAESHYAIARFQAPSTLVCNVPPFTNDGPKIPKDQDHVVVPLKLWSSASNQIFFEEKFIFYDCGAHQLCTSCVKSEWGCKWCLMDNRCVHDDSLCTNEVHVIPSRALFSGGPSSSLHDRTSTDGGNRCPHIDSDKLKSKEILLQSGDAAKIRLPVINLDSILNQADAPMSLEDLECVVKVEEREIRTKGTLGSDGWVECDSRPYSYRRESPTLTAELFLSAGGSFIIDKTQVELYKCHLLSSDCSRCMTLDPRYMCSWCGRRCTFHKFCPVNTAPSELVPSKVCPAPYIHSVEPLSGPIKGGTRITIRGRDLGTRKEDVKGRVFIANKIPCNVVHYEISTKIVCVAERSGEEIAGPIRVTIGSDSSKGGESKEHFRFVKPSLHSFHPTVGPRSGGTRLTITGNNLNIGTNLKILLGNSECSMDSESRDASDGDSVSCLTSRGRRDNWVTEEIRVQIDDDEIVLRKAFRYTPDPTVLSIQPLESFRSGGRRLLVKGTYLNSTAAPKMYLVDPIKLRSLKQTTDPSLKSGALPPLASELSDCFSINLTEMYCRSPALIQNVARVRRERDASSALEDLSPYPRWPVGFLMDGAQGVQYLDGKLEMTVVPDPEYHPFSEKKKLYREEGEPLILEGKYLSLASSKEDVQVFIGAESCNVTLVAANQLVCQPPPEQPSPLQGSEDVLPSVTVKVGFLTFDLGLLAYESAGGFAAASTMHPAVVGGIVTAAALVLLSVVVCVAVWWRRKSWQAEKEYKRIQLQMDNMESNVRSECKQAFAELQTDMSDLTSDLLAIGIPYHTRRTYAAKFLFKDEHQQGLLLDWQNCSGNGYSSHLHLALAQFESLLWNKQFVVQLVDSLESQPTFSAQDRVYVASLLTAALARNMQYCTDVVMTLLRQLVDRSVQSRYPQLMLRRTESIVEKMLANWIALCLYDYLQEDPGANLFLLFRALKHQIEKGPVDAITGEARYSLSEDRLLKEQTNTEPMMLQVIPFSDEKNGEVVPCRVLRCDSISQVKAKILDQLYRNNPFSTRPTINDFDLEWRCSPRGHVILSDDDKTTSQTKDGWKRLNTLQYYGLPSCAQIALLPRTRGSYTYTSSSSQTYTSISSSTLLIPNGHHSPAENSESGSRYWHLVRPPSMALEDPHSGTGTLNGMRDYTGTMAKSIPEVYLTRLLTSKGTVQKFVDDFFGSALRVSPETFPPVIKYLFDFLESEAQRCQVPDQSVVYAWKNNSLPLRFWVNIIKNPEFVFDIDKTPTADACLSVVAQTFMDACSASESRLGKDSPSNKLLFAKDIPGYREMVSNFYRDVRQLPPVTEQDLNAHMAQLSKAYAQEFNVLSAVREILCYAVKYSEVVLSSLDEDPLSQKHRLADRLEQVLLAMSGGQANGNVSENVYATVK